MPGPRSFGAFLLERGLVAPEDLDDATQNTVLFGGRLGTSLVESGAVELEALEAALAEYHGTQPAPPEWLHSPEPAARTAVPEELIHRHRAFPLHRDKRALHVAVLDPLDDVGLDELAFASGCRVTGYVVAECRLVDLLRRHLGVEPSGRMAVVLEEGRRARERRARGGRRVGKLELEAAPDPVAQEREALGLMPLGDEIELIDEVTFEQLHADRDAPAEIASPPEPAPSPAAVADDAPAPPECPVEDPTPSAAPADPRLLLRLEAALTQATRRDGMIAAALDLAGALVPGVALLVVRDGIAAGAAARVDGAPRDVEAAMLPLTQGSALAACASGGKPLAARADHELDRRLLKVLGATEGGPFGVFPVAIRGRIVNLIVAHAGSAELPLTARAALQVLARLLAEGYERLILRQKSTG